MCVWLCGRFVWVCEDGCISGVLFCVGACVFTGRCMCLCVCMCFVCMCACVSVCVCVRVRV